VCSFVFLTRGSCPSWPSAFLSFATDGMHNDGCVYDGLYDNWNVVYGLMQRILVYIGKVSVQHICWHCVRVWKSRASNIIRLLPPTSLTSSCFSCDVSLTHFSFLCIALPCIWAWNVSHIRPLRDLVVQRRYFALMFSLDALAAIATTGRAFPSPIQALMGSL
jgi:hypothetical protein